MSTETDIKNGRRMFAIDDLARVLEAVRNGTPIGVAFGNSAGLGQTTSASDAIQESDGVPNSKEDAENLRGPLKLGDETDKLKLKDCATGEAVTLDGLGGEDAPPVYPLGFDKCEAKTDPTYIEGMYWLLRDKPAGSPTVTESAHQTKRQAAYASPSLPQATLANWESNGALDSLSTLSFSGSGGISVSVSQVSCSSRPDPVCALPPPEPVWNESDKNHLVLDPANSCFTPLCGALNDQVLAQFQGCNDELILCDEDGEKVHIKINSDGTIEVTQKQFGQTATIKDGKVSAIKTPTKSQLDRLFQ